MRFLLYSHDGMGLGHVRRHLAIASALTTLAPETQVLLATSVDEVASLGLPPNVDTLKLPGLRKVANNHYTAKRLGIEDSDIRGLRSALLETAVHSFRPEVVLVDKHPFGVAGEFRAALKAARAHGARAVLGLRDILDDPATVQQEWRKEGLDEVVSMFYDLVLVYGSASVFDPVRQYRLAPAVGQRARYCGYVVNAAACSWNCQKTCDWLPSPVGRVVLGTPGGGEDGASLLRAFIEAADGAPWQGIAVSGPLMDEKAISELQQFARDRRVAFHRFIPCLSKFLWVLDGLVCMGGYNTLAEAVSSGIPTVCVPRVVPRVEQLLRSRAFERLGLVHTLHPDELTPDRLRTEVSRAMQTPRLDWMERARAGLGLDGAQRAARYLLELEPPGSNGHHTHRSPGRSQSMPPAVASDGPALAEAAAKQRAH